MAIRALRLIFLAAVSGEPTAEACATPSRELTLSSWKHYRCTLENRRPVRSLWPRWMSSAAAGWFLRFRLGIFTSLFRLATTVSVSELRLGQERGRQHRRCWIKSRQLRCRPPGVCPACGSGFTGGNYRWSADRRHRYGTCGFTLRTASIVGQFAPPALILTDKVTLTPKSTPTLVLRVRLAHLPQAYLACAPAWRAKERRSGSRSVQQRYSSLGRHRLVLVFLLQQHPPTERASRRVG